jgi:hypothetical protein
MQKINKACDIHNNPFTIAAVNTDRGTQPPKENGAEDNMQYT